MATKNKCIDWQFTGSEAAKEAAAASLGTYTSAIFALCDSNGKPILPPRSATLETSHTAEKAVVKAVLYGTGNAYAPSIGLPVAKRYINLIYPHYTFLVLHQSAELCYLCILSLTQIIFAFVILSAVAEYLNQKLTKKLTADDVFMTVGCKQAIELAVDILAKPNANVLLPSPGFPWDEVRAIYKNLEVRHYDFIPKNNFEIDFKSVREKVDENTFAIFIINPHNPNGNTYSEAHLKQVYIYIFKYTL